MNAQNETAQVAAALMGRSCDGDGTAFLALYQAMAPAVLAHLIARGSDHAQAQAILQTTFLELHARRAAYVRGADPLPWAKVIAEHIAARSLDAARPAWLTRVVRRLGSARASRPAPPPPNESTTCRETIGTSAPMM